MPQYAFPTQPPLLQAPALSVPGLCTERLLGLSSKQLGSMKKVDSTAKNQGHLLFETCQGDAASVAA